VLDEETELQEIVQLVGKDALPDDQQLTLEVARYLREAYLQQNAFHPVDTFCPPEKTYLMLTTIETFNDEAFDALEAGVRSRISSTPRPPRINRIGVQEDYEEYIEELKAEISEELRSLY